MPVNESQVHEQALVVRSLAQEVGVVEHQVEVHKKQLSGALFAERKAYQVPRLECALVEFKTKNPDAPVWKLADVALKSLDVTHVYCQNLPSYEQTDPDTVGRIERMNRNCVEAERKLRKCR